MSAGSASEATAGRAGPKRDMTHRGRGRRPERTELREGLAALEIREGPVALTLRVRVQPRASREALGGERDGALVVRLTAPPVEGAANRALTRLLSRALGVAPSAIRIVRGVSGRHKQVAISGIDAATARERLGAGLGE